MTTSGILNCKMQIAEFNRERSTEPVITERTEIMRERTSIKLYHFLRVSVISVAKLLFYLCFDLPHQFFQQERPSVEFPDMIANSYPVSAFMSRSNWPVAFCSMQIVLFALSKKLGDNRSCQSGKREELAEMEHRNDCRSSKVRPPLPSSFRTSNPSRPGPLPGCDRRTERAVQSPA